MVFISENIKSLEAAGPDLPNDVINTRTSTFILAENGLQRSLGKNVLKFVNLFHKTKIFSSFLNRSKITNGFSGRQTTNNEHNALFIKPTLLDMIVVG